MRALTIQFLLKGLCLVCRCTAGGAGTRTFGSQAAGGLKPEKEYDHFSASSEYRLSVVLEFYRKLLSEQNFFPTKWRTTVLFNVYWRVYQLILTAAWPLQNFWEVTVAVLHRGVGLGSKFVRPYLITFIVFSIFKTSYQKSHTVLGYLIYHVGEADSKPSREK